MSILSSAASELVRRYARVFRSAWQMRKQMEPAKRLPHEAQFLPAALALQETPVSPLPRVMMWSLVAFALIALIWAFFGRIDVVASAAGRIIPGDRTKIIQPIETAIVKAIHVRDGDEVIAGQTLIELDATDATADSERLANELRAARLQAARARALLAAYSSMVTVPRLANLEGIDRSRLEAEQHLLEGQYHEYRAKRSKLDADIAKREAELQATRELLAKLEQTAPIARQRAEDYKNLLNQNFVSRHGYLEREQQRIEQEGDLASLRSKTVELKSALLEATQQRNALAAEAKRIALDSLNEAERKIVSATQDLIKAEQHGKLLRLNAPVSGTIQQLAVHTVGGVVTPAQPLLAVVPREHALEVEAFIENKDIGFVFAGQPVEVKVETFPYTKYGTIPAKVVHVSNDAINDEKRGLIYAARVKLSKATMRVEKKVVNLSPGMAVTAEIKTGKRRVIEYFLSPLMQYKDESLRER